VRTDGPYTSQFKVILWVAIAGAVLTVIGVMVELVTVGTARGYSAADIALADNKSRFLGAFLMPAILGPAFALGGLSDSRRPTPATAHSRSRYPSLVYLLVVVVGLLSFLGFVFWTKQDLPGLGTDVTLMEANLSWGFWALLLGQLVLLLTAIGMRRFASLTMKWARAVLRGETAS